MIWFLGSLIGIIATLQLGIYSLENIWITSLQRQWRLDRCTGESMIEFKNKMSAIERSNTEMRVLRAAIVASTLQPELIPALKASLQAEFVLQEARLMEWKVRQGVYFARPSCGLPPSLPWQTLPPDLIGAQPLTWSLEAGERTHAKFKISVQEKNRKSQAQVALVQGQWHARWTDSF